MCFIGKIFSFREKSMEKFGIFELLDTLSALTAPQKNQEDGFSSPVAGNAAPDGELPVPEEMHGEAPKEPHGVKDANQRALQSLLDRHDGISKRIDGKK